MAKLDPRRGSDPAIYVVSGLPRSGTSLMMRMLEAGGLPPLTDGERVPDDDNPRGYYELEAVKRTDGRSDWLRAAGGHVVKVISQLLLGLPADREYRVVFMRRNLDEVLASQRKMLHNRGEDSPTADQAMKELFVDHLDQVERFLRAAPHIRALYVNYARVIAEPLAQARRIADFLGAPAGLDVTAMAAAVEPALYRNRVTAQLPAGA